MEVSTGSSLQSQLHELPAGAACPVRPGADRPSLRTSQVASPPVGGRVLHTPRLWRHRLSPLHGHPSGPSAQLAAARHLLLLPLAPPAAHDPPPISTRSSRRLLASQPSRNGRAGPGLDWALAAGSCGCVASTQSTDPSPHQQQAVPSHHACWLEQRSNVLPEPLGLPAGSLWGARGLAFSFSWRRTGRTKLVVSAFDLK